MHAKISQEKIEATARIKTYFQEAESFIVNDYRGLTVEQITNVRRTIAPHNAQMRVIKNRYAKIVIRDMGLPNEVEDLFSGPTAVVFVKDGETSSVVLKELFRLHKEQPSTVRGAFIEDRVLDTADAEVFSKLLSKQDTLAQLMGTMQAPMNNTVSIMQEIISKFVRTVQTVADAKEN